jgi:hypothetical protein
VKFEWDEAKRKSNIDKHGFDFVDAEKVFEGLTFTVEDTRQDYGEERFITLGLLNGEVIYIAHTEQKGNIRIIMMRKATRYEAQNYFEQIGY